MISSGIPLTTFRQILILPLTLASVESGKKVADQIHGLADRLRYASGSDDAKGWTEVDDHLEYLGKTSDKSAYAEFVYFHAYIQDFLYDRIDPKACDKKRRERSLRLFERKNRGVLDVGLNISGSTLDRPERVRVSFCLPVERLNLYLFELGVAILVVEVATGIDPKVMQGDEEVALSLTHAQALQNALRRLYPPYFLPKTIVKDEANDIPEYPAYRTWSEKKNAEAIKPSQWIAYIAGGTEKRRNPIDPVWSTILAPLVVEGEPQTGFGKWRQIIDERIPSMVFLGVRDASPIEHYDFSRLCFLDDPGQDYLYAKPFLRGFEKEHFYDRFWYGKYRTRFMFSGYSMVMLGTGEPKDKDTPGKDDDFFHYVIVEHFRRHYFQMGLLIQFQFAALLALSHRVSEAVKLKKCKGESSFRKAMLALEDEFLEFEQRYWFSQVSNQMQAREMYDLWLKQTRVGKIYEEVRDQVRAGNAYLDAREQQEQTGAMTRLSVVAAFGVVIGAAMAFLGMNVLASPDFLAVIGVPRDLSSIAKPKGWWWSATQMLTAHAAAFLAIVTFSLVLGRILLTSYGGGEEQTPLTKRINGDFGKLAKWCGISAFVLFVINLFGLH